MPTSTKTFQIIKKLSGLSGCEILLCDDQHRLFVRKISKTIEYNKRLEQQCAKQMLFSSRSATTPTVFQKGFADDLFYFDMEYIKGESFARTVLDIPVDSVQGLTLDIVKALDIRRDKSATADDIFKAKIHNLYFCQIIQKSSMRCRAINYLANCDFSDVYKSQGHGDLTFENILIRRNRLVFIDFLDSFYDSWMLDVAKLLQDIELGWSYRRQYPLNFNLNLKLILMKRALFSGIDNITNKERITIYRLLLLNIMRIYPYAKDANTIQFLDNAVVKVMKEVTK